MATLAENAAAVKAAQVAIDAAIVAKGGTTRTRRRLLRLFLQLKTLSVFLTSERFSPTTWTDTSTRRSISSQRD